MTPYLAAQQVYLNEPCARTFSEDVELHFLHGYVFSMPDLFLLGRPVNKDAPQEDIVNPAVVFRPQAFNCWHIYLASGALAQFFNYCPFPLQWVSFEIRNTLRFYEYERIRQKAIGARKPNLELSRC